MRPFGWDAAVLQYTPFSSGVAQERRTGRCRSPLRSRVNRLLDLPCRRPVKSCLPWALSAAMACCLISREAPRIGLWVCEASGKQADRFQRMATMIERQQGVLSLIKAPGAAPMRLHLTTQFDVAAAPLSCVRQAGLAALI